MNLEAIRELCLKLPAVTEDIKWENHLCFCVGEKMFAIFGLEETPITASFKVKEEDFEEYASREGFKPAPYLARYKWIWIDDIGRIGSNEWQQILEQSYELVKKKLPKKVLNRLFEQL